MTVILHDGLNSYEIFERQAQGMFVSLPSSATGEFLEFASRFQAHAFIQGLAHNRENKMALREILENQENSTECFVEDQEIWERLALLLISGQLLVRQVFDLTSIAPRYDRLVSREPEPAVAPTPPQSEDRTHYLRLILRNDSGNLIPLRRVEVTFSDGTTHQVTLDENASYEFHDAPPGQITVSLMDLKDTHAASHAVNIKKALEENNKQVIFETLKNPPRTIQELKQIYNEQLLFSGETQLAQALEQYAASLSQQEKWGLYALMSRAGIATPEEGASYYQEGDEVEWFLHAAPHLKAIIPDAKVTYHAQTRQQYLMDPDSGFIFQWFCFNDPSSVKDEGAPSLVVGPDSPRWEVGREYGRWAFLGNHTICCRVQFKSSSGQYDSPPQYVELQQGVKTEQAILTEAFANYEELPDPDNTLVFLEKYLALLHKAAQAEGSAALNPSKVEPLQEQLRHMKERFEEAEEHRKYPIRAVHIDSNGQTLPLKVALSKVSSGIFGEEWQLIDWTVVTNRNFTGVYSGTSYNRRSAIEEAIEEWQSSERYPEGRIRVSIPAEVAGNAFTREFTTDATSSLDDLSTAIGLLAFAAGLVAFFAPVPGSRVAAFAIWTSLLSATTSAVINIGQRHAEGFGDYRADAIDVLTIAGSLIGLRKVPGAQVLGLSRVYNSRIATATVISVDITGDVAQGVLISQDYIAEYQEIMEIADPHERTDRLLTFIANLAKQGMIFYMIFKGHGTELREKMPLLRSPSARIDASRSPRIEREVDSTVEITVKDQGVATHNIPRLEAPE